MGEINLKPCMSCGGQGTVKHKHWCVDMQMDDDHDKYWCECTACGARSKEIYVTNARYRNTCEAELKEAENRAVEAWNKRSGQEAVE